MDQEQKSLSFFKKWWISLRPFSFPASTMPVIFGTVLAVVYGGYEFKPLLFVLAFFGMVILHSGANVLNDVKDFLIGLDVVPSPVSGGVVRKIITVKEAKIGASILLSTGAIIGFILVYLSGIWLLVIGLGGLAVGIFYSLGKKISLKYHAFGDMAVFLDFGILGSLGSYYLQSGHLSWVPVIWAIPFSMLVIGILHANNWRDIRSDTEGKIFTVASLLGDKGSMWYYWILIFVPFFLITSFIFIPYFFLHGIPMMPFTFLVTLLALPLALRLWSKALHRDNPRKPMDFITLDGATAQLNLLFGSLCTVALLLDELIKNVK
jgi:1,4-dihydroxy-2-naphthoate octaprenyltransferase